MRTGQDWNSGNSHDSSQWSVTLVQGCLVIFTDLCWHCTHMVHIHTYKHSYKLKIQIILNSPIVMLSSENSCVIWSIFFFWVVGKDYLFFNYFKGMLSEGAGDILLIWFVKFRFYQSEEQILPLLWTQIIHPQYGDPSAPQGSGILHSSSHLLESHILKLFHTKDLPQPLHSWFIEK